MARAARDSARRPDLAWLTEETSWGARRVRLTVGPADAQFFRVRAVKSVHAVAFSGDRVLLVREWDDQWHFPGGRLEPGETPDAALARELQEEAGATLMPGAQLFAATHVVLREEDGRPCAPTYTAWYRGELTPLDPLWTGGTPDAARRAGERRLARPEEADALLRPIDRRLLEEAERWRPL